MKKDTTKKIVLIGIVLSIAAVVYYLLKLKKQSAEAVASDAAGTIATGNTTAVPAGGTAVNTGNSASGCSNCPSYQPVPSINKLNPNANLNRCGQAVLDFQAEINLRAPGQNLVVDGCYGPKTMAAHTQVLQQNSWQWPTGTVAPVVWGFNPTLAPGTPSGNAPANTNTNENTSNWDWSFAGINWYNVFFD